MLKQGTVSVIEFFTQLLTLWNELDVLRPVPIVELNFPYEGVKPLRYYENVDHVVRFLRVLNDSLTKVRSQVMLLNPMPNITQVFSMIIQQKRQFTSISPAEPEFDPAAVFFN